MPRRAIVCCTAPSPPYDLTCAETRKEIHAQEGSAVGTGAVVVAVKLPDGARGNRSNSDGSQAVLVHTTSIIAPVRVSRKTACYRGVCTVGLMVFIIAGYYGGLSYALMNSFNFVLVRRKMTLKPHCSPANVNHATG